MGLEPTRLTAPDPKSGMSTIPPQERFCFYYIMSKNLCLLSFIKDSYLFLISNYFLFFFMCTGRGSNPQPIKDCVLSAACISSFTTGAFGRVSPVGFCGIEPRSLICCQIVNHLRSSPFGCHCLVGNAGYDPATSSM